MTHLVIGVGGRLTAGKDVFADHLVEQHGFVKLGMSDVLAEALRRLNPWIPITTPKKPKKWIGALFSWLSRGDIGAGDAYVTFWRYQEFLEQEGYVEAKKNDEVRRLLQVLGTEVGRQLLGENIWVDALKKKILEVAGDNPVILTGIRYPNELDMITKIGWANTFESPDVAGVTVWVDRPGLSSSSNHSSEGSVKPEDFEYVLTNDKDLQALQIAASSLLGTIYSDYLEGTEELKARLEAAK